MLFEQVDATAMERHHRRVGWSEAVLDPHLDDAVFGGRIPSVGPREVLHGIRVHAPGADDAGAEREQGGGSLYFQRIRGTGERPLSSDGLPARS